jgi:membrane-associated PAP2 superfamily phosphatase
MASGSQHTTGRRWQCGGALTVCCAIHHPDLTVAKLCCHPSGLDEWVGRLTDGIPGLWRLDREFWIRNFAVPLLCAAALLALVEHTAVDLWLADQWFALEGQSWAWRHHWLANDLIHYRGRQLIIGLGLILFGITTLSWRVNRLRRWRRPVLYLLVSMAVLPAIVAWSKHFSPVPCPWSLQRYGGTEIYRESFGYPVSSVLARSCFPSGHASSGFALLAAYFAALPCVRRPALFLVPGLLVGWVFALGQQSRGAHFLSHDLWTLAFCWFGALALFLLFRPQHWTCRADSEPAGKASSS